MIEAEGALLDDLPDRLERFHYDLVATTTFHADEAQVLVAGRIPVVAMLVGPGYLELVHEIAGLPNGSQGRPRLRLGAGFRQHPRDARPGRHPRRRHRVRAHRRGRGPRAGRPDRRHHPALARGTRSRPGPRLLATGADPAMDLRLRSVGPGAPAPRHRARGEHPARPRRFAGLIRHLGRRRRDPGSPSRAHAVRCAGETRLPYPARAARAVRGRRIADRHARRPGRWPTRPGSAGWPAG